LTLAASALTARGATAAKKDKGRSTRSDSPLPDSGNVVAAPAPQPALTPPSPAAPSAGADQTPAGVAPNRPSPAWVDHVTLGGGAIFYDYQPIRTGAKPNLELFFAYLQVDGKLDRFGLHFEPRFRDTRMRPFFDGPAWVEEAYVWLDAGPLTIKAGKIYSRLGLFWDNSFYGNLQLFDGLKLDPDEGISVEGGFGDTRGIAFTAQYFVVDGSTNLSLVGRDTISIPSARRRDIVVGRIDPFTNLGQVGNARLGLSAEHFSADLPNGVHSVNRLAGDASVTIKRAAIWGEWLIQRGQTVTDFPYPAVAATAATPGVPGRPSLRNTYWLLGGEYTYAPVTVRYNFSEGNYTTVAVKERTHVIGLGLALRPKLILLSELVFWNRRAPEGDRLLDRSVNWTLTAHF
jgi:hypothetical protein